MSSPTPELSRLEEATRRLEHALARLEAALGRRRGRPRQVAKSEGKAAGCAEPSPEIGDMFARGS